MHIAPNTKDYRISKEEAKRAIKEGHIHKTAFGGEEYLIHYTKGKGNMDVYKLVGEAWLEKDE